MLFKQGAAAALAAWVAGASAQFATYATHGLTYEVNIPSSTAAGNSKTIFFQLTARPGTQWMGLGQGSRMAGANMFMVYAAGDGNVTLSPRSGTGQSQPKFNSAAVVSLLEGSGVQSDGSMVAIVRCDSCLSWTGGTLDPTNSNSAWIWAFRNGDAIDSPDTSVNLKQHITRGTIALNLPDGTGGSSSNPFIVAAANRSLTTSAGTSLGSSATPTAVSTAKFGSSTVLILVPPTTATSVPGSSLSSGTSISFNGLDDSTRTAYAIIMSLVFVVLMPLAALNL